MGNFTLTPVSGEQYRASITLPDGTAKEVALPAAREAGIVLWAYPNRDDETLLLRIMAGTASYGKANLLLHHGGEVLRATSLNINRPLSSLRIPREIGRASCRERVWQHGTISVGAGTLKN